MRGGDCKVDMPEVIGLGCNQLRPKPCPVEIESQRVIVDGGRFSNEDGNVRDVVLTGMLRSRISTGSL